MDARRALERVRGGHPSDQSFELGMDGRAASGRLAGESGPVLPEAATLPSEDGIRRHDDQRPPPAGPDSGKAGPEQTVDRPELRAGRQSPVDGELLVQGEVLKGELTMAADEEGEEPEQVEHEGDHEPRL